MSTATIAVASLAGAGVRQFTPNQTSTDIVGLPAALAPFNGMGWQATGPLIPMDPGVTRAANITVPIRATASVSASITITAVIYVGGVEAGRASGTVAVSTNPANAVLTVPIVGGRPFSALAPVQLAVYADVPNTPILTGTRTFTMQYGGATGTRVDAVPYSIRASRTAGESGALEHAAERVVATSRRTQDAPTVGEVADRTTAQDRHTAETATTAETAVPIALLVRDLTLAEELTEDTSFQLQVARTTMDYEGDLRELADTSGRVMLLRHAWAFDAIAVPVAERRTDASRTAVDHEYVDAVASSQNDVTRDSGDLTGTLDWATRTLDYERTVDDSDQPASDAAERTTELARAGDVSSTVEVEGSRTATADRSADAHVTTDAEGARQFLGIRRTIDVDTAALEQARRSTTGSRRTSELTRQTDSTERQTDLTRAALEQDQQLDVADRQIVLDRLSDDAATTTASAERTFDVHRHSDDLTPDVAGDATRTFDAQRASDDLLDEPLSTASRSSAASRSADDELTAAVDALFQLDVIRTGDDALRALESAARQHDAQRAATAAHDFDMDATRTSQVHRDADEILELLDTAQPSFMFIRESSDLHPDLDALADRTVAGNRTGRVDVDLDSAAARRHLAQRAGADDVDLTERALQRLALHRRAQDLVGVDVDATYRLILSRIASDLLPQPLSTATRSFTRRTTATHLESAVLEVARRTLLATRTAADSARTTDRALPSAHLRRSSSDVVPSQTDTTAGSLNARRTSTDRLTVPLEQALRVIDVARIARDLQQVLDLARRSVEAYRFGQDTTDLTDLAYASSHLRRIATDEQTAPLDDLTVLLAYHRQVEQGTDVDALTTRTTDLHRTGSGVALLEPATARQVQTSRTTDAAVDELLERLLHRVLTGRRPLTLTVQALPAAAVRLTRRDS